MENPVADGSPSRDPGRALSKSNIRAGEDAMEFVGELLADVHSRSFRLKIHSTDNFLEKHFPDGPRWFPDQGRATVGSYKELNKAIAEEFGIEDVGVYVMCYRTLDTCAFGPPRTRMPLLSACSRSSRAAAAWCCAAVGVKSATLSTPMTTSFSATCRATRLMFALQPKFMTACPRICLGRFRT
jgi:hypothetical protein